MIVDTVTRSDPLTTSRLVYEDLCRIGQGPPPRVRTWTGEEWGPQRARATLVLRHPGSLRALLDPPTDLAAGEAYVYDDVDIEGDMVALMEFASGLDHARTHPRMLRVLTRVRRLPGEFARSQTIRPGARGGFLHSVDRDRRVVSYHYDTGNPFYETFLDETMTYSCAHFLDPSEDLATAQRRKLDLVCRKLGLRPGQRLLDVGCGWGSLVTHAAAEYGVHAVGITLSSEQARYARRRAAAAGVGARVEIRELDYRRVRGTFDAISSIGMFEHVGRKNLARYFAAMRRLLAPGGAMLNHGIVDRRRTPPRKRSQTFVGTYVFPDGDLRPLDEVIGAAEQAGFEVRDVEALRQSYTETLRRWVARLESNASRAIDTSTDRTYRIWRLYMAGSAVAFDTAAIAVHQVLLADPRRSWTFGRAPLLAGDDVPGRSDKEPDGGGRR